MMDVMNANEGFDPFDLTGMTEEDFEQLEAAGEPVDVVHGSAPLMTRVGSGHDVHGVHLEYLIVSNTAGVEGFDVEIVQSTSMVLAGASKS